MDVMMSKEKFTNIEMRSNLRKVYDEKYESFKGQISERKNNDPKNIELGDGRVAQRISVDRYPEMIPSFDKWVEMQKGFSALDLQNIRKDTLAVQKRVLDYHLKNHPDTPSSVNTVFADGDQILGYLDETGLVTHSGGSILNYIDQQAKELGLEGAAYIAYMRENGGEKLAAQSVNAEVIPYDSGDMPSKREFTETWYPQKASMIDVHHQKTIESLRESIQQLENKKAQTQRDIYEMHAFLLLSMEEA